MSSYFFNLMVPQKTDLVLDLFLDLSNRDNREETRKKRIEGIGKYSDDLY